MVTWAICVPSQGHREKSLWPGQESYFWENPPSGAAERKGRSSCGRHPAVCLSLRPQATPLVPSNPGSSGSSRCSFLLPSGSSSLGWASTSPGETSDYSRPGQEPLCPYHCLDTPHHSPDPAGLKYLPTCHTAGWARGSHTSQDPTVPPFSVR